MLSEIAVSASQGADGVISADTDQDTQTQYAYIGYDSRNNQTVVVDPKGNISIVIYDGAGRAIETLQQMRSDGEGSGGPVDGKSFEGAGGL